MLRTIPAKLKKQQGKNKSSRFPRSFYLASLTFGYLWYYSSTAHTANDDKDKENTAGRSLERCKGRFLSKSHLSAVKSQVSKLYPHCSALSQKMISYFAKCFSYAISQNTGNPDALKGSLNCIVPHAFGDHRSCDMSWCDYKN